MLEVILVLSLAGFVQGLTGFGFGLAAVALLPLVLELKDAQVVVALLNVVVCVVTFLATWRHFRWRDGRGLVIGSVVGVPIGFFALVWLPAAFLLRALGLLLCVFSASELWRGERVLFRIPSSWGFPIGVAGGCLGGALNVGGPPTVAYVYSQPWTKEQIVSLMQVCFGLCAVFRLGLLINSNLIRHELVHVSLLATVPLLLTTWLGGLLLKRVPQDKLKMGVFAFLFVMGLKYLFLTH
jgi:uncharacterized membrane protein YfcA